MNRFKWTWLGGIVLMVAAATAYAGPSSGGGSPAPDFTARHQYVTGTVMRITDGMALMRTDEGARREFSVRQAERDGIADLKIGDHLQLELNEGDQIIRFGRTTVGGTPLAPERSRLIEGTVASYDPTRRRVTLELGAGRSASYRVKEAAATKMIDDSITAGAHVALQIDARNDRVEDFQRL